MKEWNVINENQIIPRNKAWINEQIKEESSGPEIQTILPQLLLLIHALSCPIIEA